MIYLGANSPSPLPSGLSTGKVERFRNFSVTNISLLSCYASEGVTSLIPSKKGEIEKSINWNCLPNEFFYQLNCFYRAMRADCFFERSHFLITLTSSLYYLFLQIPAEQQNCTSSTWDIFKSQLVILSVSFNFCIFLLLIIKTKTLHNHYERIIIDLL